MAKYIILNGKVYYIKLASNIYYFANDNVIVFLGYLRGVCRRGTDMSKRKLDDRGWWVRMRNSLHIATYEYEYISFWG